MYKQELMKAPIIIIYSKNEDNIFNLNLLLDNLIQQANIHHFSSETDLANNISSINQYLMIYDGTEADDQTQIVLERLTENISKNKYISILYLYKSQYDLDRIEKFFVDGKDEVLRTPINHFEFRARIQSAMSNLMAEREGCGTDGKCDWRRRDIKLKNESLATIFASFNRDSKALAHAETYLLKMAEVINHIPTAIIITDKIGKIEYVNAYFCTVTGYAADEIIGEEAIVLISLDNPQFVVEELLTTIRKGEVWKGELMNQRKNKSLFWSEIVIAPILDKKNDLQSYVATLTDFTEKINTQTELEELCTQLQINEARANLLNEELVAQKQELQEHRDELSQQKEQLEKQNEKLLKQRKSITASLEYALRIQQAMMAQQSELKDLFPESFLFYLPRDFISGDFYWYRKLDEHRSIIAAVDCTGHGIPGAFMSMLGSSLLSQIIEQNKIYEPETILDLLDTGIVRALNQNITNNCDGMEVSLVLVDREKNEIKFSGAGLPLAYLKDGELEFIRGSKRPIGGLQVPNLHKQSYITHTIPLVEGTICYMFSDGYADQFDKAGKRKFLVKNFRDLLSELKDKPMDEQFGHLFDTLISWKGKQKQTDDILVLGFKV